MAFAKEIRAAKASGQMVRVKRDAFDEEGNTGYIVATGRAYFVLELVTPAARNDANALRSAGSAVEMKVRRLI